MNGRQRSWLLPSALVGYVALAAIRYQDSTWSWALLVIPLALALSLRWIGAREREWLLPTARDGVQAAAVGLCLFGTALAGPEDNGAFQAALAAGEGAAAAGALLCVARMEAPEGLVVGHRAARSLDGFALVIGLWSIVGAASATRALAPDLIRLDPQAIDASFLFASLGTLLLFCAVVGRVRIVRGLELGVGDRARAALALALAGTLTGAATGFLRMAAADRVAGATVVITASAITWTAAAARAQQVSRTVRGLLALLLLGVPVALGGAWLALRAPERPATTVLATAALSMMVGLIARSVALQIMPESARWLDALTRAMSEALHPRPDLALRGALSALRRAERAAPTRPEVFEYNPPRLVSVDVAGYLSISQADFPQGVFDLAAEEPGHTLRLESVLAAEVRRPDVRATAAWFRAHEAKAATALFDEEGPVGLLVLPCGRRSKALGIEEIDLLEGLAERLTGLISVTSGLARSQERERKARQAADQHIERLDELELELSSLRAVGRRRADEWAEVLDATAHGPASQLTLSTLERFARASVIKLMTPCGVDAGPWAAGLHRLHGQETRADRPFVVVDCTSKPARDRAFWDGTDRSGPLWGVGDGTLLLLHAGALDETIACELPSLWAELVQKSPRARLVLAGRAQPAPGWFDNAPVVELPSLDKRAEDLQSLILFELSRFGLARDGAPLGMTREALAALIERSYPANELELRGILVAAATRAAGPRVTLADLEAVGPSLSATLDDDETTAPRQSLAAGEAPRRRSRRPPRSRR